MLDSKDLCWELLKAQDISTITRGTTRRRNIQNQTTTKSSGLGSIIFWSFGRTSFVITSIVMLISRSVYTAQYILHKIQPWNWEQFKRLIWSRVTDFVRSEAQFWRESVERTIRRDVWLAIDFTSISPGSNVKSKVEVEVEVEVEL